MAEADEPHPIDDLLKIMLITKRQDLEKHCRSSVIHSKGFAAFINACRAGETPWWHQLRRQEFQPSHLRFTEEDKLALLRNGVGPLSRRADKAVTKISTMFKERRLLVGHMFNTPDLLNWHFFYFDQRDRSDRNNHWAAGPHIHLINHVMWPKQDPEAFWASFCSGQVNLRGSYHVRYVDDLRDQRG